MLGQACHNYAVLVSEPGNDQQLVLELARKAVELGYQCSPVEAVLQSLQLLGSQLSALKGHAEALPVMAEAVELVLDHRDTLEEETINDIIGAWQNTVRKYYFSD